VKLSQFLKDHDAEILLEWDRFAKDVAPPGSDMSLSALRDHAKELLVAIANDIERAQSEKTQSIKSKGQLPVQGELGDAASIHGTLRHHGGFDLKEVASEFRALRASVLHLWLPLVKDMTPEFSYDMTRFNEAIDEALSESIITFSDQTARTRDIFLAVLGHDLGNPLSVISMNGEFLKKVKEGSEPIHSAGSRIVISSARMGLMINDLLEYARAQLGGRLLLKRHVVNMERICQAVVDEARAAHPAQEFVLKPSGELIGSWDEARLQQVFANLLGNAARYSEHGQPIEIVVKSQADAIAVKIHNVGPVIPAKSLRSIFEPLVQLSQQTELSEPSSHSVGLGLYIAREITEAHGGTIQATSSKHSGTTFTVLLPRHALH
jgi:signal transduction histidine kinase